MASDHSAWKETADGFGGAEGAALRHNGKTGDWTLDSVSIEALTVAFIMPTAVHGEICFPGDGQPPIRRPTRYEDRAPNREAPLTEGFNPMTEVLGVIMDGKRRRQLATFQGTNYGARRAFEGLIKPYLRKGMAAFPVVEIGSREKGDDYGNYAPTFTVVDWAGRDLFPDLLETNALPAPASSDAARLAPATAAEPAAPLPKPKPLIVVTSGRQAAAPAETKPASDDGYDGDYAGPSSPDDIDFGP